MTAAKTCWGIYRERCVARGFDVALVAPDAEFNGTFANIFVMCERGPVLDRLKQAEAAGSIVVNSPDAIRNTYRHRMIELFARHRVSTPPSQIVSTETKGPRPVKSVWIKSYDFHATETQDVMYAASEE